MFSENLSNTVLFLCEKEKLTYEDAAELCCISSRYFGSIARGEASPTVKTVEKLCNGLKVTPNELLLPKGTSILTQGAMPVSQILCIESINGKTYYPICPSCNNTIEREYQRFCDRCGNRLNWSDYKNAIVIYIAR